jgi:hypothetical protein
LRQYADSGIRTVEFLTNLKDISDAAKYGAYSIRDVGENSCCIIRLCSTDGKTYERIAVACHPMNEPAAVSECDQFHPFNLNIRSEIPANL